MLSAETLTVQTGLEAGAVGAALALLETKGFVSRQADGSYGPGGSN
jgi:DNA-binding IclR family transcriptional regulator